MFTLSEEIVYSFGRESLRIFREKCPRFNLLRFYRKLTLIIEELIATEKDYVQSLNYVVEVGGDEKLLLIACVAF